MPALASTPRPAFTTSSVQVGETLEEEEQKHFGASVTLIRPDPSAPSTRKVRNKGRGLRGGGVEPSGSWRNPKLFDLPRMGSSKSNRASELIRASNCFASQLSHYSDNHLADTPEPFCCDHRVLVSSQGSKPAPRILRGFSGEEDYPSIARFLTKGLEADPEDADQVDGQRSTEEDHFTLS